MPEAVIINGLKITITRNSVRPKKMQMKVLIDTNYLFNY